MSRIGQAGRRILYGAWIATIPAICSAQSALPDGGAKISPPVVTGVADPFAGSAPAGSVDPIPTPIMTSSGRVAEAGAAVKSLATSKVTLPKPPAAAGMQPIAPLDAPATPTNVIDAGKLVPLSIPAATTPAVTLPATREPTPDDKLAEAAPAGLKPLHPATISRETVTPLEALTTPIVDAPQATTAAKAKPVAAKKPEPKSKPVEKPSEQVAPPANFSFPQPVIPLEGALRKFWKWSTSRR